MARDPYRQVTTLQTYLVAGGVALLGFLLLWASSWRHVVRHPQLETVVIQVGGLLIVSVALAVIWELVGKRGLSQEILATAKVGADVTAAGIRRIGTSYLDDVDWAELFQGVEKLDIVMAYGGTWRGAQNARLRAVATRPHTRMHVYLPDPDDPVGLESMAKQFAMDSADLRRRILEARADFEALKVEGGGEVRVFYRPGDHVFSCYRFDNRAVITLYSHTRARANVPTIVCANGGSLYEFVRAELRAIVEQSRAAEDPAAPAQPAIGPAPAPQ